MVQMSSTSDAVCECGKTQLTVTGSPILTTTCYCQSCRTAGHKFEKGLNAPKTVNSDGGVDYALYRKDRVKVALGASHLQEHRLKPDARTRRIVANCCNSPMFLDFIPGHWLTIFRNRLPGHAPVSQMRVMTKDVPDGVKLTGAIPTYDTLPPKFFFKLLLSWAAMGFRRPKTSR